MDYQEQINTLKEYIESKDFKNFKNYIDVNNIDSNVIDTILIFLIGCNASYDFIEFLFDKSNKKDMNFKTSVNGTIKVPLFTAIENNHFKLANLLINKYEANITYEMENMIDSWLNNNTLGTKHLNYIMSKLNFKKDINILTKLIQSRNNELLRHACFKMKYTENFIVQLLSIYKNCKGDKASKAPKAPEAPVASEVSKEIPVQVVDEAPKVIPAQVVDEALAVPVVPAPKSLSEVPKAPEAPVAPKAPEVSITPEAPKAPEVPVAPKTPEICKEQIKLFDDFIKKEGKIFSDIEKLYQVAIQSENDEALYIIYQYDVDNKKIILNRITEYDLLNKAIIMNNPNWVESILKYDIKFIKKEGQISSNVEELYQVAVQKRSYDALYIIYQNDNDDDDIILKRINRYDLLEKLLLITTQIGLKIY